MDKYQSGELHPWPHAERCGVLQVGLDDNHRWCWAYFASIWNSPPGAAATVQELVSVERCGSCAHEVTNVSTGLTRWRLTSEGELLGGIRVGYYREVE